MSEHRAVVFDLDGTLVDSRDDIVRAVEVSLTLHGVTPPPPDVIARYVGDGARQLVARSLGYANDDERVDPVLAAYLEYYAAHPVDRTTPMPGAREVLAAFGHLPLALCTNKPRSVTVRVLEQFGWSRVFRTVLAGGDVEHHKPHPEPLFVIASELALSPAELVMVGDGVQDVACGRAAGAFTVAVAGGFGSDEELRRAHPDRLISALSELDAALR